MMNNTLQKKLLLQNRESFFFRPLPPMAAPRHLAVATFSCQLLAIELLADSRWLKADSV